MEEMVINEVTDEDIAASIAILDSHINENKEIIECPAQSWDMIDVSFNRELRREKRIAIFVGTSIEWEHIEFPYIREIFYSTGVRHNDIKPSEAASLEEFEKLLVNAIEGMDVKKVDVRAMVRPMSSEVTPKNWTTTNIPTIFQLSQ